MNTLATTPPKFQIGDRIYRIWKGEERLLLDQWQESCPGLCDMHLIEKVTAKQVWARSVFAGILEGEGRAFVLDRAKLERCGYAFGRDYALFFVAMPERYRRLTLGFIRDGGPRLVLGLPERFEEEDLKRAYRRLVMESHPDRGGSAERFREVQVAYETLRK